MQFDFEQLKLKFQQPLPGKASHLKMAPSARVQEMLGDTPDPANAKLSAVLILFFKEFDGLRMIVIRRSSYVGVHAGQIGFPGGRFELEDKNVLTTALREIHEEIGIPNHKIEILGRLSDIYVPPSNFLISVFAGFLNEKPTYLIQEREVAEVIEIPLNLLLKQDIVKHRDFYVSELKDPSYAPYYDLPNAQIWGASAMVISELLDILRN